jgi:cation transport protein ChaC
MGPSPDTVGAGPTSGSDPAPNPGPPGLDPLPKPLRDPQPMLERTIAEWGGHEDLWLFGYGSLIWRPEFDFIERRPAWVRGWHRALKMWSRVNRGSVQTPGLVFGLLSGGSVRGMVFRVPAAQGLDTLRRLWLREMPTGVYDPKWLRCTTASGPVSALAFTLSRRSPNFTGELSDERYRHIFANAVGRYGSSLDYAQQTLEELRRHAIHDVALARLVALAVPPAVASDTSTGHTASPAPTDCDVVPPPVYVAGSSDKKSSQPSGPSGSPDKDQQ